LPCSCRERPDLDNIVGDSIHEDLAADLAVAPSAGTADTDALEPGTRVAQIAAVLGRSVLVGARFAT
jgi:hypothetical protein